MWLASRTMGALTCLKLNCHALLPLVRFTQQDSSACQGTRCFLRILWHVIGTSPDSLKANLCAPIVCCHFRKETTDGLCSCSRKW